MTGFLLGLANGASCLAFCAPVLLPFVVAEGRGLGPSATLLARFLAGRFAGYVVFGLVAGLAGHLVHTGPGASDLLFGLTYCALAVLLLAYGLRGSAEGTRQAGPCAAAGTAARARRLAGGHTALLPVALGLLTGLNLCPPFALALVGAAGQGSVAASVWFFVTFFLGTSVFFLPLPGLGPLSRVNAMREVARLAAAVMGAFYLYRGLVLSYGGFVRS
jgi:sulfite exporter TauE/SafE